MAEQTIGFTGRKDDIMEIARRCLNKKGFISYHKLEKHRARYTTIVDAKAPLYHRHYYNEYTILRYRSPKTKRIIRDCYTHDLHFYQDYNLAPNLEDRFPYDDAIYTLDIKYELEEPEFLAVIVMADMLDCKIHFSFYGYLNGDRQIYNIENHTLQSEICCTPYYVNCRYRTGYSSPIPIRNGFFYWVNKHYLKLSPADESDMHKR